MRLMRLAPILLGALLGTALPLPVESASTYTYLLKLLPPSGSNGQVVPLTCGWHDRGCGTALGNYLDWSATNTKYAYFRGIFWRMGASYETDKLFAKRKSIQSGPNVCEIQDVYVYDRTTNILRGVMRYVHTSMNSTKDFPVATSGGGTYNAKNIGRMIDDTGSNCPWFGYHAHAGYTDSLATASTRSKNTSLYPSGDYCTLGVNCSAYKTYANNSTPSWTHQFHWSGP